jgi:hypothetical protein
VGAGCVRERSSVPELGVKQAMAAAKIAAKPVSIRMVFVILRSFITRCRRRTSRFIFLVRFRFVSRLVIMLDMCIASLRSNLAGMMITRALEPKIYICAILIFGLRSFCGAVEVPSGTKPDTYDRLLKKYVNAEGLVAYEKWKGSAEDRKALDDYLAQFARDGSAARGNERYASLVNAYNGFVLQWILQNYPTESIWALKSSFKGRRHRLGGANASLNDIENNMLRPEFGWRTHAVLVCAARSCPPLQQSAYTASGLDAQTARAFRNWLSRSDLNEFLIDKNEANISNIFKWFRSDFDKAGGVKAVLAKYAPAPARPMLERPDCKISYKSYNWGLNDQGPHGRNYKINIFDFLH